MSDKRKEELADILQEAFEEYPEFDFSWGIIEATRTREPNETAMYGLVHDIPNVTQTFGEDHKVTKAFLELILLLNGDDDVSE